MNKLVIIINGRGGVGKDTLCEIASKHYLVNNVSAIDPYKEIAKKYAGWDGNKDPKSRKFLSDLKRLFIEYNDSPFRYINDCINSFVLDRNDILFIHCREIDEIQKIVDITRDRKSIKCVTLLVIRPGMNTEIGNDSDDKVNEYDYDYVFDNKYDLQDLDHEFHAFIENVIIG